MQFTCCKAKGDELWKIKKYKGKLTCVNPLMNREALQLNVLYISSLIRPLVKPELSISVAAI